MSNETRFYLITKIVSCFIQRMMALCVSSYYKNSPNDLQLLADVHHLFVLLGPVEGQLASISQGDDEVDVEASPVRVTEAAKKVSLLEEQIKPRANLPPLLVPRRGRRPERLHYLAAVTLATALLLLSLCGVSAANPILTIHSPDGDIIDCVNKLDQPALKHPLLKNHTIQEFPSGLVQTGDEGLGWQVWHDQGTTCPPGTIPIRRFEADISHTKYGSFDPRSADLATRGHQYAIAYKNQSVYGTKATLNVWNPIVESPGDFSLAQIWLVSGQYEDNNLNTIEAGWQIYPNRYGDHQPRLFTYWTRDAYLNTGCYSTHCDGFVHVSTSIALEAAIIPTSTFGGDQFGITLQIWKDLFSGNWWLGFGANIVPIGYWPAEIFTTLFDHANQVQWGGEVLHRNNSGINTTIQMGSGKFPDKGFGEAAWFCNIQVAQENRTFLPVQDFTIGASQLESYRIKKTHSQTCGTHFYYGGPGPVYSASVRKNLFSFYVSVILLLLL